MSVIFDIDIFDPAIFDAGEYPSVLYLIHSPARILAATLVQIGLGVASTTGSKTHWQVFTDAEPEYPDNCITVKDTTGQQDGRSMIDGELYTHEGVQVRIRSTTKPIGYTKSSQLRNGMARDIYREEVTISSDEGTATYQVNAVTKIGTIIGLGKNTPTDKRSLHTINVFMSITKLS